MEIPEPAPRRPWWEGRTAKTDAPWWVLYPTSPLWLPWVVSIVGVAVVGVNLALLLDGNPEMVWFRALCVLVFGAQTAGAIMTLVWRHRRKNRTA